MFPHACLRDTRRIMIKKLITYFLLAAMLTPVLTPWFSVIHFMINREEISRTLCVNKKKPQLGCNGKCFLAKKLKQRYENDRQNNAEKLTRSCFIPVFVYKNICIRLDGPLWYTLESEKMPDGGFPHERLIIYEIFQPPEMVFSI